MYSIEDIIAEKYCDFKLNFSDGYKYYWSFYRDTPLLDEIESWYKKSELKNTTFHRSDDYGHIMIGTNDNSNALQIKMIWGDVWRPFKFHK